MKRITLRRTRLLLMSSSMCLSAIAFSGYGQTDPVAGAPYSPHPNNVLVTKVKHFDNMCWKIAAGGGTWYFENGETSGKSGFSSAFDQVGNDWIGNDADKGYNLSPSTGGKHEYRGFPNFGNGNFDHPQRSSGAKTKWLDANGKDIVFGNKLEGDHLIMRSYNSSYELEYHFFVSHIAIKVLKATDKYAFLYEGPIGGEQESDINKDYYVLKDGVKRKFNRTGGGLGYIDPEFGAAKQFPSSFFYFGDTDAKDKQVLYFGAKDLEPLTYGDEGWMQGSNMVIFSFGRKNDARTLTGTKAVCVFGFLPKADEHAKISTFIEGRLAEPFVSNMVTGVEDKEKEVDFSIYPNQTKGIINFSTPTDWKLLSLNGAVMAKGAQEIQVNLAGYPTGMYFIYIKDKAYKIMIP